MAANTPTWWRIGWRNLGRNRRRTMLTAAGLAVGYMAVVLLAGLMGGLVAEMIENGTGLVSGQIQLHAEDYLPDHTIYETLGGRDGIDVDRVLAGIDEHPGVRAATPRVYGGGLVSSGEATTAATLMGIEPRLEAQVTRLLSTLTRGRAPEPGAHEILIGVEMARQLEVEPGSEIVMVAPAADGSLGNDLYTVTGVFESGLPELDGTFALVPIATLQATLALDPSRIHEIAVSVGDPWAAPDVSAALADLVSSTVPGAELQAWTEYSPELLDYARLSNSAYWVVMVIVFGMAIFGVANTMLMGTFERRREFAVLMALGTTPPSIISIVLAEALSLAIISLAAGAVLVVPILVWWHNAPPDLSWLYGDFTFAGALVRPVLRVEYPPQWGVLGGIALFVTAVLAALYPAARAARIAPADALAGE